MQMADLSVPLLDPVLAPAPEPDAYALMIAGLGLVSYAVRRRKPA